MKKKEQLQQEWRNFVKKHHPDVGGDPEFFRKAKEEYELALVRLDKKEAPNQEIPITKQITKASYNNDFKTEVIFTNQSSPPYWLIKASLTCLALVLVWGFFIKPSLSASQIVEQEIVAEETQWREPTKEEKSEDWYLLDKTVSTEGTPYFIFTDNPAISRSGYYVTERDSTGGVFYGYFSRNLICVPASKFPKAYKNYPNGYWYTLLTIPIFGSESSPTIPPYGTFSGGAVGHTTAIFPKRNSL